jgi:hypothetical protein
LPQPFEAEGLGRQGVKYFVNNLVQKFVFDFLDFGAPIFPHLVMK